VKKWNSEDIKDKISWQLISHYIKQQYFDGWLQAFLYCHKQVIPTLDHPLQLARRNLKRNITYGYLEHWQSIFVDIQLNLCYVHLRKSWWYIIISCTDYLTSFKTFKPFLDLIQHVFAGEKLYIVIHVIKKWLM